MEDQAVDKELLPLVIPPLADGVRPGYEPANLGCARCGACCEDLWSLPRSWLETMDTDESRFLLEHWHPLDGTDNGHYRCDMLDPVHQTCTAHETRPPVCSNYPWYGGGPRAGMLFAKDTQCSYLLDLPPGERPEGSRPLIPVEVLRG